MTKPEPLQTLKHDDDVRGAQFSHDESRVLTWSGIAFSIIGAANGAARLWDVTKPEPLQTFEHDRIVFSAQFSRDESRVLTVSGIAARIWDIIDPLAVLTPSERILELEVRSGTTLDEQQELQTLKFEEWQAKVKSKEYRAIAQKLAARSAKPAQATNRKPTVEMPGSSPKR